VGQGGKVSLVNTSDTDILEYILAYLSARITFKSRTFELKSFNDHLKKSVWSTRIERIVPI
jgi:hypothetical protein